MIDEAYASPLGCSANLDTPLEVYITLCSSRATILKGRRNQLDKLSDKQQSREPALKSL